MADTPATSTDRAMFSPDDLLQPHAGGEPAVNSGECRDSTQRDGASRDTFGGFVARVRVPVLGGTVRTPLSAAGSRSSS
ncbi:hypothetical protein GCM10023203_01440 [Actinomycetospora straminea]|uniref:Uncharacterized protein n=1 Tax=Actinomycetospora straminea TaxID=663607 RepID=A0ABP9DS51_9PSEU